MAAHEGQRKSSGKNEWAKTGPERAEQRRPRGYLQIDEDEREVYEKCVTDAIQKYKLPESPAMETAPLMMFVQQEMLSLEILDTFSANQCEKMRSRHSEKLAEQAKEQFEKIKKEKRENHDPRLWKAMGPEAYWAMIHQGIPIAEPMKIEKGRLAMEEERNKLERPEGRAPAWDVKGFKSKAEVMKTGKDDGIEIHFCSIKAFCHIKNYEKGDQYWVYKGRIVLSIRND